MVARFLCAVAFGFCAAPVATAQLVVDDGFLTGSNASAGEYQTPTFRNEPGVREGSPGFPDIGLVPQNPTVSGFTGPWLTANGATCEVVPIGMSVRGLAGTGGMGSTDVYDHGTRIGRLLTAPITDATTGTFYLSVVLMDNQSHWTHGYRTMELHTGGFDDATHRRFQLGIHKRGTTEAPDAGDFGAHHYWGMRINNSRTLTHQFPRQGVESMEANFFVLKFELSAAAGGDAVTVWHNPGPGTFGGVEPLDGVTVSGFDMNFDRVSFASWENALWLNPYEGALFFDGIRMGSSWADVTPAAQPAQPAGNFLVYEFNGSLEGWQELTTPNQNWGPQRWMGATGGDAQSVPNSPGAAKQYLHLDARFPGGADLAHPTLWMRSPEFRLNGAGDLTFWIMGGGVSAGATVPANDTLVPAESVDTANGGFHGVVLRNAATGAFVLAGNRTSDGFDWQQVTFTAAQLAALDQQALYTLDAIDARNNAWSWFNLDKVSIPGFMGPPPATSIGPVLDQIIISGTSSGAIPFTLHDEQLDPAVLTVTATSSNTVLVPIENIIVQGAGANRTVTVTPAPGQTGTATITLTVTNGTSPATRPFKITVPLPTSISDIAHQELPPGAYAGPLAFQLHDDAVNPSALTIQATSSNPTLVPNANIVFWGTGANRTVRVTPAAGRYGTTTITLNVLGGTQPASMSFVVTVLPPTLYYPFLHTPPDTTPLVNKGSVWRYLDNGSDQGTAWRAHAFNDAGWKSGAAELGYGDGGEATVMEWGGNNANRHRTYYFRHTFQASNVSAYNSLLLRIRRDDGAIVYINGQEARRTNMPTGAVTYQTLASSAVGGADENTYYEFPVDTSFLNEGANTIAVEVHQSAADSSDVSFDLELVGVVSTGSTLADLGWTTVSADPVRFLAIQPGGGQGTSPDGHVGMSPQDDTQHVTGWIRSPQFRLNGAGAGDLSVWLRGGENNGPRYTNTSQVPANSVIRGFLGVVLRNAATGAIVWSGVKPAIGDTWERVVLPEANLLQLNQTAIYTLDYIDARHDGWGHGRMDNVTIPGSLVTPPSATKPPLSITALEPNRIRVSWPATAHGWILQTSSGTPLSFTDSGLAITVEESERVVYDLMNGPRYFYRLVK